MTATIQFIREIEYYICNPVSMNQNIFLYSCFVLTVIAFVALHRHYKKIPCKYWLLIVFCCYTWSELIYYGYYNRKYEISYEKEYTGNASGRTDGSPILTKQKWREESERIGIINKAAKHDVKLLTLQITEWTFVLIIAIIIFVKDYKKRRMR